jgi:hypothetical protein
VGEQIRAEQRAKLEQQNSAGLTDEVAKLRTEIQSLRQAIAGGGTVATTPSTPVTPSQPKPETPATTPDTTVPDTTNATNPAVNLEDTNGKWVVDMLRTRCASCHNTTNAKGSYSLFNGSGAGNSGDWEMRKLTAADLILIDSVVYSNEMPKAPQPKLTNEEYLRWRGYLQSQSVPIRQFVRPLAK